MVPSLRKFTMPIYVPFPSLLLVGLLLLAVGYDIAQRRIPNWLVSIGLVAGLVFSVFYFSLVLTPMPDALAVFKGYHGLGKSFLGALTGLGILLPMYLLRATGAGDVKLMAMVGAFRGPQHTVVVALLTFVAGGVLSLAAAIATRSLPRVLGNMRLMGLAVMTGRGGGLSIRDVPTTGRLPYAIAIAVGTLTDLWLVSRGGVLL